MADKNISMLNPIGSLDDDSLLVVEQGGKAGKMTGAQFREFAEDCVAPYSDAARTDAVLAVEAKNAAQNAYTGVQNAIKNIPAGSTPIINDLTTGGATMALSAEMGKKLNAEKLGLGGQIPANADLNDYTTGGLYYISGDNSKTCANIPDASAGNLAVFRFDTTIYQRTIQIFTRVNVATPVLWYRKGLDGGWSEWKQFATTDSTVSLLGGTKIADCSLNDCKTPGNYYGSFNNITDGPVGASGSFYMFVRDQYNSGAYIEQEVTLGANFVRYQRRWNGSAWGAWFATGGKVSGSYTGNGDATARTIDTGGIGNVVEIHSSKGSAIVNAVNGLCYSSSGVAALASTAAKFVGGVLTLATDNDKLNANGVTYYYQVL